MTSIRRLPAPLADLWEWQVHGACRGMDTELFFHPEHERGPARADREAQAKGVCRECPVLARCRSHALIVREPYGIWGGLSAPERAQLAHALFEPAPAAVPAPRSAGGVVRIGTRRAR